MNDKQLLTIDVEEYYHVGRPGEGPDARDVRSLASRVEADVARVLDLLVRHDAHATFFILGEVALAHPLLVERIEAMGHEVASHGFRHIPVDTMTPAEFAADLDASLAALGFSARNRPLGYRAPIWSVGKAPWALDLLIARGFRYDSSFAPVPLLGPSELAHRPTVLRRERGTILELPPLTGRWLSWRFPLGFALGLRLIPSRMLFRAIRAENEGGRPAVLAFHPWELDPDPPALRLAPALALAHGFGLERLRAKLEELLKEFRFGTVRDVCLGDGAGREVAA